VTDVGCRQEAARSQLLHVVCLLRAADDVPALPHSDLL
jgi:hypothetical protein